MRMPKRWKPLRPTSKVLNMESTRACIYAKVVVKNSYVTFSLYCYLLFKGLECTHLLSLAQSAPPVVVLKECKVASHAAPFVHLALAMVGQRGGNHRITSFLHC